MKLGVPERDRTSDLPPAARKPMRTALPVELQAQKHCRCLGGFPCGEKAEVDPRVEPDIDNLVERKPRQGFYTAS